MGVPWCIWLFFGFVSGVRCDEIFVEVSFGVSADYNESNFYDNLLRPVNVSRTVSNASNVTGNVSLSNASGTPNTTEPPVIDSPFVIPLVKNPIYRMLNVAPILCVIGFDYNCFNDTNVTRLDAYYPVPTTDGSLPVGIIAGTCATVAVLAVVLSIWLTGGFKKKPAPVEKKLVMPIRIDWPKIDPNKKLNLGNGTWGGNPYPSNPLAGVAQSSQPIQFMQYIHPIHPLQHTHSLSFNHA